jgi:hypothetical protein
MPNITLDFIMGEVEFQVQERRHCKSQEGKNYNDELIGKAELIVNSSLHTCQMLLP